MKIRRPKAPAKPTKKIGKPAKLSRYKGDSEFREKHKLAARESYRKTTDNFELVSPKRSLDYYATLAEPLTVEYNGITKTHSCIKVTQLADLLQISYQSLWRHLSGGSIPSPVLITRMGKRELLVYSQDEVRAILTVIGEHKKRFSYYRKDHHSTREKLFAEINTIRTSWEQSWQPHRVNLAVQPQPKSRKPKPLSRKKP